jgi:hypothetical protein
MPNDNTIPQNTEGTEVLTLAITPKFSTSTLEIIFSAPCIQSGIGSGGPTVALFQDSTANAIAGQALNAASTRSHTGVLRHVMTSGTTSSTTFKIRVGANANTCYINADSSGNRLDGGVANTYLTISEYL